MRPDTTSTALPLLYLSHSETDSLLAADSLLFRHGSSAIHGRFGGMPAQPLPPTLFRNDGVSIALLCCFMLTLLFLARSRFSLGQRLKTFFQPRQLQSNASAADAETHEAVHFLLGCQLSLIASLLYYSYASTQLSATLISLPPLALLGIYAGVFALLLVTKQLLYRFVHSVFFTTMQRRRWYESFSLIFVFESLLLFPLALLSVYFDLSPEKAAVILAFLLFGVKILLLFKSFSAFFGKIKGSLHLIVYFCALELIPLLLAWGFLAELTRILITIF